MVGYGLMNKQTNERSKKNESTDENDLKFEL